MEEIYLGMFFGLLFFTFIFLLFYTRSRFAPLILSPLYALPMILNENPIVSSKNLFIASVVTFLGLLSLSFLVGIIFVINKRIKEKNINKYILKEIKSLIKKEKIDFHYEKRLIGYIKDATYSGENIKIKIYKPTKEIVMYKYTPEDDYGNFGLVKDNYKKIAYGKINENNEIEDIKSFYNIVESDAINRYFVKEVFNKIITAETLNSLLKNKKEIVSLVQV